MKASVRENVPGESGLRFSGKWWKAELREEVKKVKARPKPRPHFLIVKLAPVAFFENPAIVAVNPMMGNPVPTGVGWTIPAAGCPDVAIAVPAMVAVDPNISAIRRWWTALNDGGRRSDADHNLREGSGRSQTES